MPKLHKNNFENENSHNASLVSDSTFLVFSLLPPQLAKLDLNIYDAAS